MIAAPDHLLSLEEWMALPEDNSRNYELQEGVVIASPKSHSLHQRVAARLAVGVYHQLPSGWGVLGGVEVVTESDFPACVRVPDVVIYRDDIDADTPHGIPFYWVIDLGEPLSLVAYHLAEDGRYREASAATRIFETSEPFSLEVDLVGLSEGRNT